MKRFSIFVLLIVTFVFTGCPGESTRELTPLEHAGKTFASGDTEGALAEFEKLVESEGSAARSGIGWCRLRLGDYLAAYSEFAAIATDSLPDAYAGWAFVSWALNTPSMAVSLSQTVLELDPGFTLSIDDRIEASDLIWIQAAGYFEMGDYAPSLAAIKILDPSFNPSLSDPEIARLLAEKLQNLGSVHF